LQEQVAVRDAAYKLLTELRRRTTSRDFMYWEDNLRRHEPIMSKCVECIKQGTGAVNLSPEIFRAAWMVAFPLHLDSALPIPSALQFLGEGLVNRLTEFLLQLARKKKYIGYLTFDPTLIRQFLGAFNTWRIREMAMRVLNADRQTLRIRQAIDNDNDGALTDAQRAGLEAMIVSLLRDRAQLVATISALRNTTP
jgi:hypothetical protein